jgi:oligoribonuclease NrnB/cAMP/cGMP phosphodiesterase (DHH superfamily)
VSCGILTSKHLKDVTTYYCNYGEIDDVIADNLRHFDKLIISDLSPSESTLMRIMGEIEVVVIDHHKTSRWLKNYPGMIHDESKCATLLVHEWLRDQGCDVSKYDNYVDCVNDVDLWKLQREDSLQMNMLFMKLGIKRFEKRFFDKAYDGFTETEDLIIELETDRRDFYIKKASTSGFVFKDLDGLEAYFVFAEDYNSELGNHIIVNEGVDYVIMINMQKKKASLRARRDVDISWLAEQNGGGGHPQAAGFPLDYDFDIDNFLEYIGVL